MKRVVVLMVLLLVVIGIVVAARYRALPITSGKTEVVASFYPLGFFASQIAGNKAEVTTITPAGSEPHDYDPSTQDVARMERAKLLILNGANLEAWGNNSKENLKGTDVRVISVGDAIAHRQLTENGTTNLDPHVWLDPLLAKQEADNIAQALEQVDPVNRLTYQTNIDRLDTRLDQLNSDYKAGLQSCQKKDIVTSHAAFGYLAAEYGLNQVAITGLSPDSEPSAQQLASITSFVHQKVIDYIFFESLVSPKLSDTIATETGTKTLELNPIEGLTEQEMKQGKDYFGLMRDNLTNLKIALVCQ